MDTEVSVRNHARSSHPWFGRIVFGLDKRLRRRLSVIEYTNNPRCICRIEIKALKRDVMLADGTSSLCGDRAIILHLWNEQVPVMPDRGPSVAWARRMRRGFEVSLRELVRYLAHQPDLDDVLVVHGKLATGRRQTARLMRLIARFGFEAAIEPGPVTMLQRSRWLGENVLISLLVWAHNAVALRYDTLWRDRIHLFLSRRMLEARYGAGRSRLKTLEPVADIVDQ